jgi:hypothetical protein
MSTLQIYQLKDASKKSPNQIQQDLIGKVRQPRVPNKTAMPCMSITCGAMSKK